MTPMETRCDIIADFNMEHGSRPQYADFVRYHDLGVSLATAVDAGMMVGLLPQGEACINDAWRALCDMLDVDPHGVYTRLDDMLAAGTPVAVRA